MPGNFVVNTALLLLGSFAAVLLTEVAVRLAYDYLPGGVQHMVRDIRRWGITGPKLGPAWFDYCVADDDLIARNLPDLRRNRVQFGPALYHLSTTNAGFEGLGFRSPVQTGSIDGVVVGDSFSFCHHVEIEACWVTLVAAETGLAMANLAVPATGSVSHSRYLERYGRELEPRFVIWPYWVNDPREDFLQLIANRRPCPAVHQEIIPIGMREWLKQGSATANIIHALWQGFKSGPATAALRTDVYVFDTTDGRSLIAWRDEGGAQFPEVAAKGFELTLGALGLAARRSAARETAFLLLIAPSNLQVYADSLPNDVLRSEMKSENETTDRLIGFAVENGIDYLDLRAAFIERAAAGDELYPDYDVHWTARGNRLAAELVADWVQASVQQGARAERSRNSAER